MGVFSTREEFEDSQSIMSSEEESSTASEEVYSVSRLNGALDNDLENHLDLLRDGSENANVATEVINTPLFTARVRQQALEMVGASKKSPFSQYGLIAGEISQPLSERDPRLFYNMAAPSSVFICGSQGSGKSHSLSCFLENALIDYEGNTLPKPLTGVVFHYDTFVSDTGGSPCEAAYLSSNKDVSVRVLCAPTNISQIRRIYRRLPNVVIEELRINETDLNTKRMLDLMAVSSIDGGMPLYLHVVIRILRELRIDQQQTNSGFDYGKFKEMIDVEALKEGQLGPLQQRLETLESFMPQRQAKAYDLFKPKGQSQKQAKKQTNGTAHRQTKAKHGNNWEPEAGQLTIVDLSCPCITPEMACSLFGICLSLFLEHKSDVGKVIALDEAHKYMNESAEAKALTELLLSTIRLQRHLGARIIISTQEPTVSPKLLDLCSVTIVHRFTSPDWMEALRKHLAGASKWTKDEAPPRANKNDHDDGEMTTGVRPLHLDFSNLTAALFSRIVKLRPGEALIFAPSAVIDIKEKHADHQTSGGVDGELNLNGVCLGRIETVRLGHRVLQARVRKRVTEDGGRSIMAD